MRASVVITTYNRRSVVPQAVESVLGQSLRDIEVTVVDDGSTDGTADELTRRFGQDSRLRVIRRVNGGPPVARNTGLDASSGPYVALLDSDDIWHPEYLASQVDVLERHPEADMVLDNGMCHAPGGESVPLFDQPGWVFPHTIDAMCELSYILPSFSVFRSRVLRELRFDETFRVGDDTELMWRFLAAGHRSVGNPRTLAEYRAVCQPGGEAAAQLTGEQDPILLAAYDVWKRYGDRYPRAIDRGPDFHREFAEVLIRNDRAHEARWHAERFAQAAPDDPDAERLLRLSGAVGQTTAS
ncbi:glycosyltransferase [Micromonospora rifamycinica]|uniref:glycosyltransferase family 2 protein n=1 Tax=Micromonospora rifamycinica TaxID=291594 RepID=UPI002E29497E|nr:glycosyltransferase family 2 protein [Micromonospora rifamycinica]